MRLIDADELMKQYGIENATKYGNKNAKQQEHSYSTMMLYEIADMIEDAPTVDAVPVVKGKWIYNDFIKEWECSNCHSSISLSDDRNSHPNYCPHCGADMRKKVGE